MSPKGTGTVKDTVTWYRQKIGTGLCKGLPIQPKIVSHASGAIFSKVLDNDEIYFAVMEYRKGEKISLRNMMETGEVGETIIGTLSRGLKEEVANDPSSFITTIFDEPVYIELKKDDNSEDHHLQIFYTCKTTDVMRDKSSFDGDVILGPIRWIEAEALLTTMRLKETPLSHVNAVLSRMADIATENKEVAIRYMQLLSEFKPHTFTKEEDELIRDYMSKR